MEFFKENLLINLTEDLDFEYLEIEKKLDLYDFRESSLSIIYDSKEVGVLKVFLFRNNFDESDSVRYVSKSINNKISEFGGISLSNEYISELIHENEYIQSKFLDNKKIAIIDEILIYEEYRRNGIGTFIIKNIKNILSNIFFDNISFVLLQSYSFDKNKEIYQDKLNEFYKKNGFKRIDFKGYDMCEFEMLGKKNFDDITFFYLE